MSPKTSSYHNDCRHGSTERRSSSSFSEVYYKFVWDDVFGEGRAIPNSEKGSPGVGYFGVVIIWRGGGEGRVSSSCSHTQSRMHMRGFNDDEVGMSIYRSWVEFEDH